MSDKTARILAKLADHPSAEVREVASVLHDVAKTVPFKRKRLRNLRRVRPDLLDRLEEVGWIFPRWDFDGFDAPDDPDWVEGATMDGELLGPGDEHRVRSVLLILDDPPF